MTEMDLITGVAQVGFPIAVSCWLLIKGYNQDQKYLEVLTKLAEKMDRVQVCLDKLQK